MTQERDATALWQDIATAPKDGTFQVVAHFDDRCFYWWHRARFHRGAWRTGGGTVHPSYWLFIPPHTPEHPPDPGQQWKFGNEWLPFHPQASHIPPDYRDGWNRAYWMAIGRSVSQPTGAAGGWMPIETAPKPAGLPRTMFVVRGFNVREGTYTTDAYAVWRDADGGFARWPHPFPPTHWMPLPAPPSQGTAE